METKPGLTKKQFVGFLLVGVLSVATVAAAFWIVPEKYHVLIGAAIFCVMFVIELVGTRKRNPEKK